MTATVYRARRQPLVSRGATSSQASVSLDKPKVMTAFDNLGRTENLPDEIAQQLRARILNESLPPGQRLPTEQELGAQFGVSRNVVREAIARLKLTGLVETRHGVGTFVCADLAMRPFEVSHDDLLDLAPLIHVHQLRVEIESGAAALAATQARELGIKTLLLGGDGWPSDNLVSLAGKSLEGCLFVNHLDFDGAAAKPMRDEYKKKYNKNAELNSYMVHDALAMVVDAMQRAKSVEPVAIQKALTTCDIQGITGHIKIGPNHDPVGKEAWLIKIVGPDMKFQEKFAAKD